MNGTKSSERPGPVAYRWRACFHTVWEVFAAGRKAGRPAGTVDLMLAAIARVRGANVVTRNVADFEGVGLMIINPWED